MLYDGRRADAGREGQRTEPGLLGFSHVVTDPRFHLGIYGTRAISLGERIVVR